MEKSSANPHKEFVRPLAHFPPSIWDHNFFLSLKNSIPQSHFEVIEVMKEKVKTLLLDSTSNFVQKVILIDQLCQLGVSYHFQTEIEDQLHYIWDRQFDTLIGNDYDLYTTALLFRTFRLHGFRMPSDIFNKFKGNDGKLKEELASDVKGMLQLYEASYLRTHNEDFLDEVRDFTISSLKFLITNQSSPHVVDHINNSLEWPILMRLRRLQARHYIDFYEKDEEIQNKQLLTFAKIDFNIVQIMLRNELIELIRWDIRGIDDLPKYMKILYKVTLEFENQLEIELTNEGTSFCIFYEQKTQKEMIESHLVEAKRCDEDYVPTFDEYVENGLKTSGFPRLMISAMLGMEDFAGIKEFEWLHNKPKILKALQMISRLGDDLKTIEHEYKRAHVATGMKCFMKQYGSLEKEAIDEISKIVEDSWKELNEECMRPTVVSRPILMLFVNSARTLHFLYKYRDANTFTECLKDYITSLLVDQINTHRR